MANVLITTSAFPLWRTEGLNQFMLDYALELSKYHTVSVLAPNNKNAKTYEQWDGIRVYRHRQFPLFNFSIAYGSGIVGNILKNPLLVFVVPFFFMLQLIATHKLVKKHNIEILNAHWIIPQGVVSALYKLLFNRKLKLLSTAHGSDLLSLNFAIGDFLKKFVLKNSDALSVVSHTLEKKAQNLCFRGEIAVCPMGINMDIFKKSTPQPSLIHTYNLKEKFTLLFVGNLIKEKGVIELFQAYKILKQKYTHLALLVVGNGKLKEHLIKQNKHDDIHFVDSVPNQELVHLYSCADLFVLPSYSEGYSLVIREALCCELPVVSTEIPALIEDHELKRLLYLVPSKDSNALAKMIEFVMKNKEEINQLNSQRRSYVINTGSWNIIGKKLNDLLNNI